MLVIAQTKGQSIIFRNSVTGEEIEIKVNDVSGKKVQVAIRASRDWEITRTSDKKEQAK